ncbi:MAG: NADH-quinone oxidoreductase subunit NuoB [Candidatus Methanomethylicia archaeon]
MKILKWARERSPWIALFHAGGCNNCDIEVVDSLTPRFDIERLGILLKQNPRHADILVVTGCVTKHSKVFLKRIYDQMLYPNVVVAVGTCACTGGVFVDGVGVELKETHAVIGGVDKVVPVDVYVPGCPPKPEAIIQGVIKAIGKLKEK